MTSADERPVAYIDEHDTPALAHMPKGKLFPGDDLFTALCGARVIGVDAPPGHPVCPICEEETEKIVFGLLH